MSKGLDEGAMEVEWRNIFEIEKIGGHPSIDVSVHGDTLQSKSPESIRIFFDNVNGFKLYGKKTKQGYSIYEKPNA